MISPARSARDATGPLSLVIAGPARRGGGSFCDGRSAYTDDPLDADPTPAPPGCLMLMPPMR